MCISVHIGCSLENSSSAEEEKNKSGSKTGVKEEFVGIVVHLACTGENLEREYSRRAFSRPYPLKFQ